MVRRSGTWVLSLGFALSMFCSCSEAAIGVGKKLAIELLQMENVTDLTISTGFIFLGYVFQYFLIGGLFELTNPKGINSSLLSEKERERRIRQVSSETKLGLQSLFMTIALTMCWMYWIDPIGPYYGFFDRHEYTWWWAVLSLVVYIAFYDTWFYWTHWVLHQNTYLWNKIHFVHHQFKEPTPFAQFSVHPIEVVVHGPMGHYLSTLLFPYHPVALACFGFFFGAWALAAHDGRAFDVNSHYYHHSKGRGRHNYFNLGFVTPAWDLIMGSRWSETHPRWVEWKSRRVADTRDGTKTGIPNDIYGAYASADPKDY